MMGNHSISWATLGASASFLSRIGQGKRGLSILLLAVLLSACGGEQASVPVALKDNGEPSGQESKQEYQEADQATTLDWQQYQMPTYIGSDSRAQMALFDKLNQISTRTDAEQKQWLLLRLSLFANDKAQSLAKLQAITESLTKASEASAAKGAQDYELMAAMGSALSYQSIFYQADLGTMNLLSRKGMRYMDRAVKQAPKHLGVRLLRGISYANMPAFLNRASYAVEDLSLLKKALLAQTADSVSDGNDNNLAKKTPKHKQNKLFIEFIDYYLALSFFKNADIDAAQHLWQGLENHASDQWASLASARLKEV